MTTNAFFLSNWKSVFTANNDGIRALIKRGDLHQYMEEKGDEGVERFRADAIPVIRNALKKKRDVSLNEYLLSVKPLIPSMKLEGLQIMRMIENRFGDDEFIVEYAYDEDYDFAWIHDQLSEMVFNLKCGLDPKGPDKIYSMPTERGMRPAYRTMSKGYSSIFQVTMISTTLIRALQGQSRRG